jgi:ketosteroid isomerase-like protein
MQRIIILLIVGILFNFCTMEERNAPIEEWKAEIVKTETDFAQMAKEKGMPAAFLHYAAEDAVLNRNNTIVNGKAEMAQYFDNQTLKDINLEWLPDFVDVSASGDMAYTYGKFTFSAIDTSGTPLNAKGIFHTVWKRQANGEWKFVWD